MFVTSEAKNKSIENNCLEIFFATKLGVLFRLKPPLVGAAGWLYWGMVLVLKSLGDGVNAPSQTEKNKMKNFSGFKDTKYTPSFPKKKKK